MGHDLLGQYLLFLGYPQVLTLLTSTQIPGLHLTRKRFRLQQHTSVHDHYKRLCPSENENKRTRSFNGKQAPQKSTQQMLIPGTQQGRWMLYSFITMTTRGSGFNSSKGNQQRPLTFKIKALTYKAARCRSTGFMAMFTEKRFQSQQEVSTKERSSENLLPLIKKTPSRTDCPAAAGQLRGSFCPGMIQ